MLFFCIVIKSKKTTMEQTRVIPIFPTKRRFNHEVLDQI